ncbi:hypothetical protein EVB61_125 [Rhizobium phage RHph_TM21B]|nr:hypothetical protein EVB61_125 [Rhizobium phage RHph_TM21B]
MWKWLCGFFGSFEDPIVASEDPSVPTFVTCSYNYVHRDNSNKIHFWSHPYRHPYQVYGGPHHPEPSTATQSERRQIWTNVYDLPGYALIEDDYTDRLYLVWRHEGYVNEYEPYASAFGSRRKKVALA